MDDPFSVLGLPADASDEAIRARYLELVRENPPERAPERFARIQEAYDRLREPTARLETLILSPPAGEQSVRELIDEAAERLRGAPIPREALWRLAEEP